METKMLTEPTMPSIGSGNPVTDLSRKEAAIQQMDMKRKIR